MSALDACDIRAVAKDKESTPNSRASMDKAKATNPDTTTYAVSVGLLQESIAILVANNNPRRWEIDVYPECLKVTWDVPISNPSYLRETEITLFICNNYGRAAKTFESELIGNSPAPLPNQRGPPTFYGTTPDQLSQAGNDFMALWVRGNVVIKVSGMADRVADFWTRNSPAPLDAAIVTGRALPVPQVVPAVTFSGNEQAVECEDVFTPVFTLPFDCDNWSLTDLNVEQNAPVCDVSHPPFDRCGDGGRQQPGLIANQGPFDNIQDLIVLRRMERDSRNPQQFSCELGGPESVRPHTLQFCFTDKNTSRVTAVQVPITVVAGSA